MGCPYMVITGSLSAAPRAWISPIGNQANLRAISDFVKARSLPICTILYCSPNYGISLICGSEICETFNSQWSGRVRGGVRGFVSTRANFFFFSLVRGDRCW